MIDPALCGRAVGQALARDWQRAELFLTVGLCCPRTGVPVLLALRMWRGVGNCLHYASRLAGDWEAAWRAGRTVVIAQGSIDVAEEYNRPSISWTMQKQ